MNEPEKKTLSLLGIDEGKIEFAMRLTELFETFLVEWEGGDDEDPPDFLDFMNWLNIQIETVGKLLEQ